MEEPEEELQPPTLDVHVLRSPFPCKRDVSHRVNKAHHECARFHPSLINFLTFDFSRRQISLKYRSACKSSSSLLMARDHCLPEGKETTQKHLEASPRHYLEVKQPPRGLPKSHVAYWATEMNPWFGPSQLLFHSCTSYIS